jgi:putative tryptophan/tyrosine transport system substrate-binding protein
VKRRDFITLAGAAAAAWPLAATPSAGQQERAGKALPRVGVLEPYAAADPGYRMREALRDVGLEEGRDIMVEWRYAESDTARIPALAAELAQLKLDAIVAIGDFAIQAVRQAAPTTPIIAGTDDLVGEGHAASLNRPGGNVTGISIMASELNAKRIEVLKEAVPSASRVLVLWDPATGTFHLPLLGSVAQALDTQLQVHEVRRREDLDPVFEMAQSWRAEAVNVLASPLLHALREPIIAQAAVHRLPAIYQWEESARAGGLMSYGPIRRDVYQAISRQLARVLKGIVPAELPVEQPTKFELVINLKTAKALGLQIPPTLLARADEVIE